mmetsp:Transcript_27010/g.88901  ORF Transcript_27010/g.88901 Transcript_27010/m.88901 type:complete len:289 (-) Transcript_27010:1284-2150(-)
MATSTIPSAVHPEGARRTRGARERGRPTRPPVTTRKLTVIAMANHSHSITLPATRAATVAPEASSASAPCTPCVPPDSAACATRDCSCWRRCFSSSSWLAVQPLLLRCRAAIPPTSPAPGPCAARSLCRCSDALSGATLNDDSAKRQMPFGNCTQNSPACPAARDRTLPIWPTGISGSWLIHTTRLPTATRRVFARCSTSSWRTAPAAHRQTAWTILTPAAQHADATSLPPTTADRSAAKQSRSAPSTSSGMRSTTSGRAVRTRAGVRASASHCDGLRNTASPSSRTG